MRAGPFTLVRQPVRDRLHFFLELPHRAPQDQHVAHQAGDARENGDGRHDRDDEPDHEPRGHASMLHEVGGRSGAWRDTRQRRQTPSLLAKKSWM